MSKKIYNWLTLWLTVSLIFFAAEYLTDWLEVVTLGGLVAGAFIEGLFVLLGVKIAQIVVGKEFFRAGTSPVKGRWGDIIKAVLIIAAVALQGVLSLCRMLPGYTLNFNLAHAVFLLLLYPAAALLASMVITEKELSQNGN